MEKEQILAVVRQANTLLKEKKYADALELLDQLDTDGEEGGLICFMRGNAHMLLEDDQQAHLCYSEALNKGFADKHLFINFAVVKSRLGNLLQAEMLFRQAADLDPTDALPLNRILLLRLARRDFEGAEAVMDELMERNPELVDGYHHKADLLLGTGRPQEALDLLLGVTQRFSSNSLYLYDLCRALRRTGQAEKALDLLEEHKDAFRTELEEQLFKKQKAHLLVDLERYDEALPLWHELYDLFGDRQSGLALAADALARQDMEALYRIACEMIEPQVEDDSHYLCLYYKALALKQLGDEAAAREAFVQASTQFDELEEGRVSTQLRSLRATIRMELGRYEDALADLDGLEETIRQAGGSPEDTQRALEGLEELRRQARQRMDSFV